MNRRLRKEDVFWDHPEPGAEMIGCLPRELPVLGPCSPSICAQEAVGQFLGALDAAMADGGGGSGSGHLSWR